MHTTFEIEPEEWTEGFWKKIMPLFGQRKVRVTVEDIDNVTLSQHDAYLRMKALEKNYPPLKVDPSLDLSSLADESNGFVS